MDGSLKGQLMKHYMLRNHIPLSGPAMREPCTGDEEFMRPSVGFTPQWYHERLGIDFSEIWHTDPRYRYKSLVDMKELLHALFPSLENFLPEYDEEGTEHSCATVSGVYGIMLLSGIYGIPLLFRKDQWPDAADSSSIPKEELKDLPPFNEEYLMQHPLVINLFRQMDEIEHTWKMVHGYLNYQGIINVAVKTAGTDIFIDMIDDPEYVHQLLSHIAGTIETLCKMVQKRQRKSGFQVNLLSMSNCTMNMISPSHYEEFLLPLDSSLSRKYPRFGIHTCSWVIDPYLDVLQKIPKMGYLDTGMKSDLLRVRELFHETRRAVLYHPGDLISKSMGEIFSDFDRLRKEYAPCDVVLADIDTGTPDGKLQDVISCIEELSRKGAQQ